MNRALVTLLPDMPEQRAANIVQITLRLDKAQMKRIEAIAEKMSRPGVPYGRTDALRYVIALGVDAAEAAQGTPPKTKR